MFNRKKFEPEIALLKQLGEKRKHSPVVFDEAGVKSKLLIRIAAETKPALTRYDWQHKKIAALRFRYLIGAFLGLSLMAGTVVAAEGSKPGDVLYPVQKAKENVQLTLAGSQEEKAQLLGNFAQKRLNELRQLHQQDKKHVNSQTKAAIGEVNHALGHLREIKIQLEEKNGPGSAASLSEGTKIIETSFRELENPQEENSEPERVPVNKSEVKTQNDQKNDNQSEQLKLKNKNPD
ncbi:MAG: DUF5667 domain-containing protein [bacterium]|nr:DUF5667 domain-containing protein [bacterium]